MAKLPWERGHPQLFARLRFAGGVFLLVLAAILLGYDTDLWLSAVLVVLAALNFYTAYPLPQTIRAMKSSTVSSSAANV
jgi:uncharacterized membrane protein YdbT with pleckstrin-like domain